MPMGNMIIDHKNRGTFEKFMNIDEKQLNNN